MGELSLSGVPGKMLTALARYPDGLTAGRLGSLVGASGRKSTRRNAVNRLCREGLITTEGGTSGFIKITEQGLAVARVEPLPTGAELLDHWRSKVGGAPAVVFETLVAAWPERLSYDEIGERAGLDPSLSTLRNAVNKLRNLGIVEGSSADTHIDDDLMEAAVTVGR